MLEVQWLSKSQHLDNVMDQVMDYMFKICSNTQVPAAINYGWLNPFLAFFTFYWYFRVFLVFLIQSWYMWVLMCHLKVSRKGIHAKNQLVYSKKLCKMFLQMCNIGTVILSRASELPVETVLIFCCVRLLCAGRIIKIHRDIDATVLN